MRVHLAPLLLLLAAAPAVAGEPAPSPLPSQSVPVPVADQPEPPPAPLKVEEEPVKVAPTPTASPPSKRSEPAPLPAERPYRIAAWTGVGLTLGLVAAGTVLGVLAQHNSDELQRQTTQLVDGKPPVYDAAEQARYSDLMTHGVSWNRATIACFVVAGVTAVTSGLLFWDASRRAADKKDKLALRPVFSTGPGSAQLGVLGKF